MKPLTLHPLLSFLCGALSSLEFIYSMPIIIMIVMIFIRIVLYNPYDIGLIVEICLMSLFLKQFTYMTSSKVLR